MIKLLSTLLCAVFSVFVVRAGNGLHPDLFPLINEKLAPFYYGVASGDPGQNSVVIWTKLVADTTQKLLVQWQMATDTLMQQIAQQGQAETDYRSNFTVKVTVKNLQPGQTYYYRFIHNEAVSPVGRTKTAPQTASELRFAVVSCANYEAGYFNAYQLLASRNDVDAVIHLGDYIYEYSRGSYGRNDATRAHVPRHEIVSLQDYRTRYAQYRLDPPVQELHRMHPMIAVWDDHEFANNAHVAGAQNHQAAEGDWEVRKKAARKAYFEWMPVQEDESVQSIVRHINYGNLAEMWMLDSRVEGRAPQLKSHTDAALNSPEQTMLGTAQTDWLINGLVNSKAAWKIVGNQVMFSEMDAGHLSKKHKRNLDAWDGYPTERNRIYDSLYINNIKNIAVITGDIHSSWAFDLVRNPRDKKVYRRTNTDNVIGVELIATSVTSGNLDERVARPIAKSVEGLMKNRNRNPHLHYVNLVDHGYMFLQLTAEALTANWVYVRTLQQPDEKYVNGPAFRSRFNDNILKRVR